MPMWTGLNHLSVLVYKSLSAYHAITIGRVFGPEQSLCGVQRVTQLFLAEFQSHFFFS